MIAGKFDPQSFFHHTENVALHVPASELFGLLKRAVDLPTQWAALIARTTGDHEVVRPGGSVGDDEAQSVMFIRVTPVEVKFDESELVSRDGFACKVEIRARLSVIPERGELLSFQKNLLGSRRVAQTEGLASYLQPSLRAALARFAAEHDAAALVDARISGDVSNAITEAFEPACFSAGLMLERHPTVHFESTSLRQVQQVQRTAAVRHAEHEASRQLDEALQKARSEHVDQLASLLKRLNELAAASPDVKLPDLLRTFSERQRGQLYEALFATEKSATQTQWIVVAAAEELFFFDPAALDAPSRRLRIDGPAGHARSVQGAAMSDRPPVLLVGAATGVYLWPVDRSAPELSFLVPDVPRVRGGFNAAALVGDRLFATHSELGIYDWNVSDPTAGRPRFECLTRGAKAVRDVRVIDGHVHVAIDKLVVSWHVDYNGDELPIRGYKGSESTITAVHPSPAGLFAGNSDGDVLHWPSFSVDVPELLHRGQKRPVESIWLHSSHGVEQLIFTDTSHRVHAKVMGDTFACHYEAGGQTLRRVEVAPDLLVATTELRDRLICWSPGKPDKPFASIALASLTGRSVQDVCLVPTL